MDATRPEQSLADFFAAPIGDTGVTNLDLYMIGDAVLNLVGISMTLGHETPASSLDYLGPEVDLHHSRLIIRDFTAWVGRRDQAAARRLRNYVDGTGWQRQQIANLHSTPEDAA